MDTIKIKKKKVKMIAHRGVSGLERENTCPAFVAAGNRSYFGIETDVHRTADGKYVVIHDETTERTTNGKINLNVEQLNFDQIKDVVMPDLDGSENRRDIVIPQLIDYINICKKYDKKAVLEIKNRFQKEHLAEVVEIIRGAQYLDNVIFISFSLENCIDLRDLLPNQEIQFLSAQEINSEMIETLEKYKFNLDIQYKRLNSKVIKILHKKKITVNCWTVNEKIDGEALVKMGVDYITTNILE